MLYNVIQCSISVGCVIVGCCFLFYKPLVFCTPNTHPHPQRGRRVGASLVLVSVGTLNRKAHGLQLPFAWPAEPTSERVRAGMAGTWGERWGKSQLVGGFNHLEKYESQWEGLSHILWTNKKCSKPPISQFFGEREKRCWEMKNFTSPPESLAFHKSCKDWEPGTDGSSPAWGPVLCSWTKMRSTRYLEIASPITAMNRGAITVCAIWL